MRGSPSTDGRGRTPSRGHRGHLCGLSHGSAGIGWALLELFVSTGDERFREAAEGAFAYERSWFDAGSGTWADLRAGGSRRGASRRFRSPAAGTWCHGEAGIALTRLRASAVLGPATYRDEAELALEATRRELLRAQLQRARRSHAVPWRGRRRRCAAVRGAALGGRRPEAAGAGRGVDRALRRRAPVTGPAGRRAARARACSAGSAGSPGGCCGCTTPRSRRRSCCPSAVDTPARAGVGSSRRPPTLATEEVYACPQFRVSIHSSEPSRAHCPVPPRSRASRAAPAVPELVTLVGYVGGLVVTPRNGQQLAAGLPRLALDHVVPHRGHGHHPRRHAPGRREPCARS